MDEDNETTYETPKSLCLNRNYIFICVYWWIRQRIRNTLIVVDRYLGRASSGIVLSPMIRRYLSTTSKCSGFLMALTDDYVTRAYEIATIAISYEGLANSSVCRECFCYLIRGTIIYHLYGITTIDMSYVGLINSSVWHKICYYLIPRT